MNVRNDVSELVLNVVVNKALVILHENVEVHARLVLVVGKVIDVTLLVVEIKHKGRLVNKLRLA